LPERKKTCAFGKAEKCLEGGRLQRWAGELSIRGAKEGGGGREKIATPPL